MTEHAEEDDLNAPPPQIQAAIKNNDIGNLLDLDWDEPSAETPVSPILQNNAPGSSFNDLLSLGGGGSGGSSTQAAPAPASNNMDDIMNLFNSPTSPPPQQQQQQQYQSPMMNDFTSDLFGESSPQPAQSSTTTNTTQPVAKDPFADLF
ncbi:hypothetical protein G6F42_019040 [Rhizopus arrhizus]|nr:hypothetical protein G6F42_019040 [Rhizopus arrhizus]